MRLVDKELFSKMSNSESQNSASDLAKDILEVMGVEVEVVGDIPKNGPVLLVSNHPGGVDSMIMLSLFERSDSKQVALASHQELSDVLAEITFPIYRKRKLRDTLKGVVVKGYDTHILQDVNEIMLRNRESISQAAEHVSQGGLTVIYPTGTGGSLNQSGNWKPGVGFLAKQIDNNQARVVFARIEGTHKLDLMRYLRPELRWLVFSPKKVKVTFSKPINLGEFDQNLDGKEIAQQLEALYESAF